MQEHETGLVLVGKAGCHLCSERSELVRAEARRRHLTLRELDAALDPLLERRFGQRVPVVLWNGEPLVELDFDAAELREALDRVGA
ncbi:glutaredoxin family protein [Thermoleophilum album]|uniref:glutaredoxin family protein n=1 Tax=Thermoleophilum album TaxID=29539 RepID=UPI00237CB2B3|nr:glutaredoxin family protein [Thermoleophilum album]WDT92931.1 glutaredoxin family protein [Thermoleophilum album]